VRPPYPWRASEAAQSTAARLAVSLADLDFSDTGLFDALDFFRESWSIQSRLEGVDGNALRVTIRTIDLPLANCLGLIIIRMHDLAYAVDEDGVVVIGPKGTVAPNDALEATQYLEGARTLEVGDETLAERRAADARAMSDATRSVTMNLAFDEAPIEDVVAYLQEASGLHVVMAGCSYRTPFRTSTGGAPKVSLHGILTVEEALHKLAEQADGAVVYENGLVTIDSRENAEERTTWLREQEEAIQRLMTSRVSFDAPEIAGWQLAAELQRQTGVPVRVEESVWMQEEPIHAPIGAHRLRESLDYVAAQSGLEWRLVKGTVYLFR